MRLRKRLVPDERRISNYGVKRGPIRLSPPRKKVARVDGVSRADPESSTELISRSGCLTFQDLDPDKPYPDGRSRRSERLQSMAACRKERSVAAARLKY